MAVTIRHSFVDDDGALATGCGSAVTFTTTGGYTLSRVDLKLADWADDRDVTVNIDLYSVDGSSKPNVLLYNIGTIDQDTLTPTSTWHQFSGLSYALSGSTEYAIVCDVDNKDGTSSFFWTRGFNQYPGSRWQREYWIPGGCQDYSVAYGGTWNFKCYEDSSAVVYAEGTKTVTAAATVDYITGPGKAWNPSPTDDQEDIAIIGRTRINTLTWNAPTDETPDYLVYFRAYGGTWALQETITDDSTSHTLSASVRNSLTYYSTYEWRVDTRDLIGGETLTTTGDTWTFISQQEGSWTDFDRPSDYDEDQVWQPGTGWDDINDFEYTGGGRFKGRVLVVGHKVLYFGDL